MSILRTKEGNSRGGINGVKWAMLEDEEEMMEGWLDWLTDVIEEMRKKGDLGARGGGDEEGLLVMIPKKGDLSRVENW